MRDAFRTEVPDVHAQNRGRYVRPTLAKLSDAFSCDTGFRDSEIAHHCWRCGWEDAWMIPKISQPKSLRYGVGDKPEGWYLPIQVTPLIEERLFLS
jgi:hypothetical protein